jgi:transposase
VGQWKSLSDAQILEAMGGGDYKGRRALVGELRKVMDSFQPTSESMALLLRSNAHDIQRIKEEQRDIERMLEKLTAENAAVQELRRTKGIATNTAAKMIAEIIDIRRFAREDSLACYSGLGMREHSTGQTTSMVPSQLFNHRLKDAFMTAAKNVVYYNPDSHLAGYHRNLIKAGMSWLGATKRVARALVRVIYRRLSALTAQSVEVQTTGSEEHQEKGESGMASGPTRSGQGHVSNIPPSSPVNNRARTVSRVKRVVSATRSTKDLGRRKAIPKKNT